MVNCHKPIADSIVSQDSNKKSELSDVQASGIVQGPHMSKIKYEKQ